LGIRELKSFRRFSVREDWSANRSLVSTQCFTFIDEITIDGIHCIRRTRIAVHHLQKSPSPQSKVYFAVARHESFDSSTKRLVLRFSRRSAAISGIRN